MTQLSIFSTQTADVDAAPKPVFCTSHAERISEQLQTRGINFGRWSTKPLLRPGAGQEEILNSYEAEITALHRKENYQTIDVMRVNPDQNQTKTAQLRQQFLHEHRHAEDEVRCFVEGRGLFSLHINEEVIQVLCETNDWITIPAETRHWFDMGATPNYCVIRFFQKSEGWIAKFTKDTIARRYPYLD